MPPHDTRFFYKHNIYHNYFFKIVERVDPSSRNNDAIISASILGHLDVIKYLLQDERVDPSDNDNYPIYIAAVNRDVDMVTCL